MRPQSKQLGLREQPCADQGLSRGSKHVWRGAVEGGDQGIELANRCAAAERAYFGAGQQVSNSAITAEIGEEDLCRTGVNTASSGRDLDRSGQGAPEVGDEPKTETCW